ncbi:poly(A) RNA polymerase cid11, putative [Entamoeba dispar SAW760]|uniref:Poly(A) RNA polymerase cid11, putative n=1 Tax=Entamoeba dispar (strain ATCC PRA-260 / SAW760) TaxID=370354 RepID=B0EFP3_ENTDS|nr:poly(A) RNA polymerase cid11, putative [Entamoeba dispar SAW760]EDR26674.1 poly(A) RNA polymerase cid11, putative [Entamoeba dispar SAW760]|eukprot:EDR26674.1 poly(A) RNA polymerase cid11, putative [Entamoeba dispar SAW760]
MSISNDGKRMRGNNERRIKRDKPYNKRKKQAGSSEDILNDQLEKIFDRVILPDELVEIRYEVMERVEHVLNLNYVDFMFKGQVYGSTHYGLCLKDGDLDICCTSQSGRQVSPVVLESFAECFKRNKFEVKNVIETAKVPIIKMIDLETKVKIDLSFNQPVAQIHSEFFYTMIACIKHFRIVAVLLKYWLKIRNLNCPFKGGLSSAALCFMICHYFTTFDPPLFPSDFRYYLVPPCELRILGSKLPAQVTMQHTPASLVKGFFDYYKNFDYDYPIQPTLGELPENYFLVPAVMTVLDPISLVNCTKGVSMDGLKALKMELTRASKILSEENDFNKLLEKPVPFPE